MPKFKGTFEGETTGGSNGLIIICVIIGLGGLSGVLWAAATFLAGWAAFIGAVAAAVMVSSAGLAVAVWCLLWLRDRRRLQKGERMMGRPVPSLLPGVDWVFHQLPNPMRTALEPPHRIKVPSWRADRETEKQGR